MPNAICGKYAKTLGAYFKENIKTSNLVEQFDISGKVDTNNPIYKFYEKDIGKYLQNKYGAKQIMDDRGVMWWEVPIRKEQARLPVEAFAAIPFAGLNQDKEETPKFSLLEFLTK